MFYIVQFYSSNQTCCLPAQEVPSTCRWIGLKGKIQSLADSRKSHAGNVAFSHSKAPVFHLQSRKQTRLYIKEGGYCSKHPGQRERKRDIPGRLWWMEVIHLCFFSADRMVEGAGSVMRDRFNILFCLSLVWKCFRPCNMKPLVTLFSSVEQ